MQHVHTRSCPHCPQTVNIDTIVKSFSCVLVRAVAQESIETLTVKMVRGREGDVDSRQKALRALIHITSCALNSIALAERLEVSNRALDEELTEARLRGHCHENTPGKVAVRTMPSSERQMNDDFGWDAVLNHHLRVKEYARRYLSNQDDLKAFLAVQRRFVTQKRFDILEAQRKLKEVMGVKDYFSQIFEALKDSGSEGPECTVCLSNSTLLAFPPCGHHCCATCMNRWLSQSDKCPHCRGVIKQSEVLRLNVADLGHTTNEPDIELARAYGSKPAALVGWLREVLAADPEAKVIVFSMWRVFCRYTLMNGV